MTLILSLITNKYVQIALTLLAAMAGMWAYGKHQHSLGYSQAQSERHTADLEAFKSEAIKLTGLSVSIEQQIATIRSEQPKIIERYTRVVEKNPLPADCVIDPERLRAINESIASANSRKHGATVPGH